MGHGPGGARVSLVRMQRVKTDRIILSHKNIWVHSISAEKYLKKEQTEILD